MTKAIQMMKDDYGDYDEEQEAELDRWLAGLDDGQDEDR